MDDEFISKKEVVKILEKERYSNATIDRLISLIMTYQTYERD